MIYLRRSCARQKRKDTPTDRSRISSIVTRVMLIRDVRTWESTAFINWLIHAPLNLKHELLTTIQLSTLRTSRCLQTERKSSCLVQVLTVSDKVLSLITPVYTVFLQRRSVVMK